MNLLNALRSGQTSRYPTTADISEILSPWEPTLTTCFNNEVKDETLQFVIGKLALCDTMVHTTEQI